MSSSSSYSLSSSSSDSSSSFWEANGVTVVTREYDTSGNIISVGIPSVSFGSISSGGSSAIRVVGMDVSGATVVGNIKIGITAFDHKGSVGSVFSYKTVDTFPCDASDMIPFPGLNSTGKSDNPNNVEVGNISPVASRYLVISASSPMGVIDPIHCVFTWFFDFNLPVSEIQNASLEQN